MRARSRALPHRSRPRWAPTARAIRLQPCGEPSYQYWAISDCSDVRAALVLPPRRFTSSKSRTYGALASVGGPGRRNCEGTAIMKGVTRLHWGSIAGQLPTATAGSAIGGFAGTGLGWGCHCPGAVPGVYSAGAPELSVLRAASIALATPWPMAIPLVLPTPSGTLARAAA